MTMRREAVTVAVVSVALEQLEELEAKADPVQMEPKEARAQPHAQPTQHLVMLGRALMAPLRQLALTHLNHSVAEVAVEAAGRRTT